MKRMLVLATILAWIPAAAAWAQNVGGGGVFPPNEVDQIKVDMAIEKGIKYLKANNASHLGTKDHVGRKMSNRELVLFTYVHSDVPETDADFKTLFDDMVKDKLEATYCVALQAMVLEEVERVKYQKRVLMCAQVPGRTIRAPRASELRLALDLRRGHRDIPKRKDGPRAAARRPDGVKQFELPQPDADEAQGRDQQRSRSKRTATAKATTTRTRSTRPSACAPASTRASSSRRRLIDPRSSGCATARRRTRSRPRTSLKAA
jgi:hypothetical protein